MQLVILRICSIPTYKCGLLAKKTPQGKFNGKEKDSDQQERLNIYYHSKDDRVLLPKKSEKVYIKFTRLKRGSYHPKHKTSETYKYNRYGNSFIGWRIFNN